MPRQQKSTGFSPQMINLENTLAALAEPSRLAVIDLLSQRPRRASEIADALSMTRPAMSRHLRVLRKAGLVSESELEDDARVRVYRLEQQPFGVLRGWLDEVEAFWGVQLQAFKAHAERTRGNSPGKKRRPV
jgi:DNA-binding transcriptional ArsR family regulator